MILAVTLSVLALHAGPAMPAPGEGGTDCGGTVACGAVTGPPGHVHGLPVVRLRWAKLSAPAGQTQRVSTPSLRRA